MSNIDLVKGAYEDFARGDITALMGRFDDTMEWHTPESVPFGGVYRGRDEIAGFFGRLPDYFGELRVEPDQFIADGDGNVVVRGHHRGRGKKSGQEFDVDWAMFWTIQDGKIQRFHEVVDSAELNPAIA